MSTSNVNGAEAPFDLSDLSESYSQAEAPEQKDFEEVPDGTYQAKIDKAFLAKSQKDQRMLRWYLKIISGPQAGRMLFKNNMMVTADNMKFLKGDLAVCGIVLENITKLPAALGQLLDVCLEVKKTTKGEYSNLYIQKRITVDAGTLAAAGSSAGPLANDGLAPF